VTSAPVLALPDFTKGFIVECDVSTMALGRSFSKISI
jgi:hypothetical protein